MAAILPHLEVPDEASDVERAYDMCVGTINGSTLGEDAPSCPSPSAVLADAHAGLLGLVFVRDAVREMMQGLEFVVKPGDAQDKDRRNIYMVLDRPSGRGPLWNPLSNPSVQQYNLLSWTSKMNAPSWSLPAGAPEIGGTCPGATAGQSVVPVGKLNRSAKYVNRGLGRPDDAPVNLAQSICEQCYATGGQYSTGNVQFAQILRALWARQAINVVVDGPYGPSTAFIETMVYAIDNTDYRLNGGAIKQNKETGEEQQKLPAEPTGRRFFRIHDSGDFFSTEYLRQWKMIADRLPDITFWAPSRIWATSDGTRAVNEINGDPRNFIIRPSAYEVNEAGPVDLGPGWAAATTVISPKQNLGMAPELEEYVFGVSDRVQPTMTGPDPRYDWNCQAYAVDDKNHTCRKAVAPPGYGGPDGKGCRACWLVPSERVNYTLH